MRLHENINKKPTDDSHAFNTTLCDLLFLFLFFLFLRFFGLILFLLVHPHQRQAVMEIIIILNAQISASDFRKQHTGWILTHKSKSGMWFVVIATGMGTFTDLDDQAFAFARVGIAEHGTVPESIARARLVEGATKLETFGDLFIIIMRIIFGRIRIFCSATMLQICVSSSGGLRRCECGSIDSTRLTFGASKSSSLSMSAMVDN